MFDVFDILVSDPSSDPRFELRHQQGAAGLSDDRILYCDGTRIARVALAKEAYTNVEAWTGSPDRGSWTVFLANGPANEAAANDDAWARFRAALVRLLQAHRSWRVTCESDCDQLLTPVGMRVNSPAGSDGQGTRMSSRLRRATLLAA